MKCSAALLILLVAASPAAAATCRSAALELTSRDTNIELGDYGILFREASKPECQTVVRDQLLRKLRQALAEAPAADAVIGRQVRSFERWLAGAHVGLAIPTAMQLGGAGLLDAVLDHAVRSVITSYRFNADPTCGTNFYNECIDDLTQAAVAYSWIAAYEQKSDRREPAASYAAQAREVIDRSLAFDNHLCVRAGDSAVPRVCSELADVENGLATGYYNIVSFNHGFQDVAYGIGLMTSLSSAAIALEVADAPFEATDEEISVAWALFHEGQQRTMSDGSAFRSDCFRVIAGAMRSDSPCADAEYHPRMFPVRTFYQRAFRNAPNEDPFRFDSADPSLFTTAFINDGRYAVYVELGERWWHVRPLLDGYRGAPLRVRTVRH